MVNEIESLMTHIHPSARELVRKSVLQTFVNMVACHRNECAEIEQIAKEVGSENFGSW